MKITAQKMKKSLMGNFIFCAVYVTFYVKYIQACKVNLTFLPFCSYVYNLVSIK